MPSPFLLRPLAHGHRVREFNYTTPHAICQEKTSKNLHKIFFPNLQDLPIAFCYGLWYNNNVKRGRKPSLQRLENKPQSDEENSQKSFQKPLDKSHNLWYNKYTERESQTSQNKNFYKDGVYYGREENH